MAKTIIPIEVSIENCTSGHRISLKIEGREYNRVNVHSSCDLREAQANVQQALKLSQTTSDNSLVNRICAIISATPPLQF